MRARVSSALEASSFSVMGLSFEASWYRDWALSHLEKSLRRVWYMKESRGMTSISACRSFMVATVAIVSPVSGFLMFSDPKS